MEDLLMEEVKELEKVTEYLGLNDLCLTYKKNKWYFENGDKEVDFLDGLKIINEGIKGNSRFFNYINKYYPKVLGVFKKYNVLNKNIRLYDMIYELFDNNEFYLSYYYNKDEEKVGPIEIFNGHEFIIVFDYCYNSINEDSFMLHGYIGDDESPVCAELNFIDSNERYISKRVYEKVAEILEVLEKYKKWEE